MAELPDERQVVLRARSQLPEWTSDARAQAYTELFEGESAVEPAAREDSVALVVLAPRAEA